MLKSMSSLLKMRLAVGIVVMILLLTDVITNPYVVVPIALSCYLFVSYSTLQAAFKDLVRRRRMTEQFLMSIATFGAIALQDYAEAIAIMVFYHIGNAFEEYAAQRSHGEITSLVKLKPNKVRLIHEDGTEELVPPRKVKVGSRIRVLAGESIGLDGTLVASSASIDLSALNGESEPAAFKQNEEIPSGGINMGSVIELIVTKDSKNSSITRLINLIEDAAANKSRPEALITRFSVYYTPIVVTFAVLLALVPVVMPNETFQEWLPRALVFLVVSCPCALVLSVPLSFFGGLGAISKIGVMIKGSIHIESLAKLKSIAFDKTGTITKGRFTIIDLATFNEADKTFSSSFNANDYCIEALQNNSEHKNSLERQYLEYIYSLESYTTHPIGTAIVNFCAQAKLNKFEVQDIHEIAGFGIEGTINGERVLLGKRAWVEERLNIQVQSSQLVGTDIYLVISNQLKARVTLSDEIKDQAQSAFDQLRSLNINTYMITGDRKSVAEDIAKRCHIQNFYAEQLPEDKLTTFKQIQSKDGVVAYVGDGINDAPTLATSDVGIAMGQFGSASAVEAADVVVMNDNLSKIPLAIDLARRTYRLAIENMALVIGVKALILILGAFGLANIWLAILGDVGLCVIAVLNAMRTLTWTKNTNIN